MIYLDENDHQSVSKSFYVRNEDQPVYQEVCDRSETKEITIYALQDQVVWNSFFATNGHVGQGQQEVNDN